MSDQPLIVNVFYGKERNLIESFPIEIGKFSPETTVYQHACPMWVPLIENNRHLSEGGKFFIQEDVQKMMEKDPKIDVIILACTHFPILKNYIESIVPKEVKE